MKRRGLFVSSVHVGVTRDAGVTDQIGTLRPLALAHERSVARGPGQSSRYVGHFRDGPEMYKRNSCARRFIRSRLIAWIGRVVVSSIYRLVILPNYQ